MLLSKMEYKNAKANIITKPIKNYKKDRENIIKIFQRMKKSKN